MYEDIEGRQLDRHRFGQLHHCAFGCAVGGSKCSAEDGIHAGDVDDFSSAMLDHRGRRKLRKQKAGVEVGLDHPIPEIRRITHQLENRYGISSDMQPSDRLTEVTRDQSRRLRITLWSDPIGFGKFQLRFPYFIGLTHPQVGLILRKNS